jgi:serine/threonine protein phosphatase PrpC
MPKFFSYSLSDTGRVRIRNEDACAVIDPLDRSTLRNSNILYVIADRMGEQASTFAVQSRLCVHDQTTQVPTGKACVKSTFSSIKACSTTPGWPNLHGSVP